MGTLDGSGNVIPYVLPVSAGPGTLQYAYLGLSIDNSDDAKRIATSLYIDSGPSLPNPRLLDPYDDTEFYIQLGTYIINANFSITVISGGVGIGNQVIDSWRQWFSSPVVFGYEGNPA